MNLESKFSPSDLMKFFTSPFEVWVDLYSAKVDGKLFQKDPEDPLMALISTLGDRHEKFVLDNFNNEHSIHPRVWLNRKLSRSSVTNIPEGSKEEKILATLEAMKRGDEIIYQASLENENFYGKADFLVKKKGKSKFGNYFYEVLDAKLARNGKPEHIIQLLVYSELLEKAQETKPEKAYLVYGNFVPQEIEPKNYASFYEAFKEKFLKFHKEFDPKIVPDPALFSNWGLYSEYAKKILQKDNNLSLIAGIRQSQILKLGEAGIMTLESLVSLDNLKKVGLPLKVLERLKLQADMQLKSLKNSKLEYQLLLHDENGTGLFALPPKNKHDLFFDLESNTLNTPRAIHYLWGFAEDSNKRKFSRFWAHDEGQMKKALEDFIDEISKRLSKDSKMHVYHYGAFEVNTLKSLVSFFSTREDELDHLLRNNVFVDLFKIVKQAFCIGAEGYGLKDIEPLYREGRTEEVKGGAESMIQYEIWIQTNELSQDESDSKVLKEIMEYNREDCFSLIDLTNWMRKEQNKNKLFYVSAAEEELKPTPIDIAYELKSQFSDKFSDKFNYPHIEFLTDLCLYHKRELKPMWWRYFDMLFSEDEDLELDLDCLANAVKTGNEIPVKRSIAYEYKFDKFQESKIKKDDSVKIKSNPELSVTLHSIDSEKGTLELKSTKELPNVVSLIPYNHVPPKVIEESLLNITKRYYETEKIKPCLETFFKKERPTLKNDREPNLINWGKDILSSSIAVISAMQETTLCIQGPPGSGKTYVGARAIAELIKAGKTVGISSNSHKAINNIIEELITVMDDTKLQGKIIKIDGNKDEPLYQNKRIKRKDNVKEISFSEGIKVFGGTAWAMCNSIMKDKLDYLFVDEAGQVSVANLVGMSQATKNIVLIGDQMQLSQPAKGVHPGSAGLSSLKFFLDDAATIPNDKGILLSGTHRLHPEICDFISNEVYEGRLSSEGEAKNRTLKISKGNKSITKEAGILYVPINHSGNSQASLEEADSISEIINDLTKCEKYDTSEKAFKKISHQDILVVAPYNHQVRLLQEKLPKGIDVGTVDKFQGREAEIVIVSMTSSDIFEAPRGIDFLMEKNRLNVAVTRAKTLAIIVGSEDLHQPEAKSIKNMEIQNFYISLIKEAF